MKFTGIIRKEGKHYVALCPELNVASQGSTIESALKNLREAVELYIEETGVPDTNSDFSIIANFEVKTEGKNAVQKTK